MSCRCCPALDRTQLLGLSVCVEGGVVLGGGYRAAHKHGEHVTIGISNVRMLASHEGFKTRFNLSSRLHVNVLQKTN